MATNHKNPQGLLNRMSPVADDIKLGDMLQGMIKAHNDLLAKLDADTGVNSTDYAATLTLQDVNQRSG